MKKDLEKICDTALDKVEQYSEEAERYAQLYALAVLMLEMYLPMKGKTWAELIEESVEVGKEKMYN